VIDLKSLAAALSLRTAWEPPATPTGGVPESERPWHVLIPAKHGHIYVHGENTLGAFTDAPNVAAILRTLPGVAPHKRGDREYSFLFPPDYLEQVAQVLHARRRRRLSEATRARLVERTARWNERRRQAHTTEAGATP
jgi:hypothetical protein